MATQIITKMVIKPKLLSNTTIYTTKSLYPISCYHFSGYFRTFSSNESQKQEGALRQKWNYAVATVKSFMKGMKLLIADVKQVRQLGRQMGGLKINGTPPKNSEIKLKDVHFIIKTRQDLKRTLPAIAIFWIPLVGYVAPFLALAFPHVLLSSHFWSDEQKASFDKKAKQSRSENTQLLIQYFIKDKSEECALIRDTLQQLQGSSSFEWIKESPVININLNQLSRQHLKLLSSSWGVHTFIPSSWWLRRKLTKHLNYIYYCDHLIATGNEISDTLKEEVIKERNIKTESELETSLKLWSSITTANTSCPYVLLGHLPLMLNEEILK